MSGLDRFENARLGQTGPDQDRRGCRRQITSRIRVRIRAGTVASLPRLGQTATGRGAQAWGGDVPLVDACTWHARQYFAHASFVRIHVLSGL